MAQPAPIRQSIKYITGRLMDDEKHGAHDLRMLTVAHLIDSFDSHLAISVKTGQTTASTRQWYRHQLGKLRTAAGKFPAAELRAHHLISVDFTYHFVRALKALYRWAADEELVPKSPFRKLRTPSCGQRNRTLTRPEMLRLYRAAAPSFRRFLFLAAHTLARPGELRLLRWCEVHIEQRCLLLTEFKAKERRRDGVKVRAIPLDRPATRMLANLKSKRVSLSPDATVLLAPKGRPWTRNGLRCAMRRARKKAGLDDAGGERVVCYTLRHTGATEATRRGMRDIALARRMGHTSTRTTARYQHLDTADLVRMIDQAAERRPQ